MAGRIRGALVATVAAGVLTALAAGPALAGTTKPVAPTANAIRTAGGKVVLKVDGQPITAGQEIKGRHVEAWVYVPNVKFTRPAQLFLADYQTSSFDLATSNQRFLQATTAKLVAGRWNVLKLELRCKMKVGRCRHAGRLYKHQLDVGVGVPIGSARPFEWLGGYPKYSGKQLLAAAFVKAKCAKPRSHPKPCQRRCDRDRSKEGRGHR